MASLQITPLSEKIEITNDALINANKLRNNNLQKRQIKEVITDIIRRISQELILAHREGSHYIITSIPITFSISNMSNRDSQRCIWSNVIGELKKKSYRVVISPTKDTCRIKITWMSIGDETEVEYQTNLIAKHTQSF
jgi:hypothetical protein